MFEALTFTREQVVEKWIEWLRSDQFDQIDGQLGRQSPSEKPERCCLGVVCDVVREFNPEFHMGVDADAGYEVEFGEEHESTVLPAEIKKFLGYSSQNADVYVPGYGNIWYMFDLASLNDDGLTFDQIADLIEAGYTGQGAREMSRRHGQETTEFNWGQGDPFWNPNPDN